MILLSEIQLAGTVEKRPVKAKRNYGGQVYRNHKAAIIYLQKIVPSIIVGYCTITML